MSRLLPGGLPRHSCGKEPALELIAKLLSVFILGAFELWAAIPAGLVLELNAMLVAVTAAAGAILGALAVVLLGHRLRDWLMKHHGGEKKPGGKKGFIYRVWDRFGVAGLGLLAPVLTGAPLAAALGVSLGVPARRLLLWISIGTLIWSPLLTAASVLGAAGFESLGE